MGSRPDMTLVFPGRQGMDKAGLYSCTAEQLPPLLLLSLIALIAAGQGRSHLPAPLVCGSFHPQLVPQAWISAPAPPGAAGHMVGAHLLSLFLRIKLMFLIKRHRGVAGRQSPSSAEAPCLCACLQKAQATCTGRDSKAFS